MEEGTKREPHALVDLDIVIFRCLAAVDDQPYFAQIRATESSLDQILEKVGLNDKILFLTGKTNFRSEVTETYKSHRKDQKRPRFLTEVKNYYVTEKNALRIEGMEADDLIAMAFQPGDVIVSLDKDYKTITGAKIYNWVKDEYYTVENGWRFFCKQMLTGDKADAVKGIRNPNKLSHKKQPIFTDKSVGEFLDDKTTEEMKAVVEELYRNEFGSDWFEKFETNGRLLWLKRTPDDEFLNQW